MPKANRKNTFLDQVKSRGYMSGNDVTWTGENVPDHIYKWMVDMALMEIDHDIPPSALLSECIVAGGCVGNDFILAKNRDRKYTPSIAIIRKLSKRGIEIVLMHDKTSGFVEGMNEYGIGVVNSTLLNVDDSDKKSGYNKKQGNIVHRALCCRTLQDAVDIICYHKGGLEGHTIVSDGNKMYHIEHARNQLPHILELDPYSKFSVHTNHGVKYPDSGFEVKDGNNYISSKIRKAIAEVELQSCSDEKDIFKTLRSQNFSPESNYNMHRRVAPEAGLSTSSQLVMNLPQRVFSFHNYPSHCNFCGIQDLSLIHI